jgi:hypothetical protein
MKKLSLFCVQEHNSKKHHYDLRIEHNGYARSWVLYREFPTSEDRLAIKMPPHKLKYLTKEGGNSKIIVFGKCNILSWKENRIKFWLQARTVTGELVAGLWTLEKTNKRSWVLHKIKL